MAKLKISRRNFMGSMIATAAVLPLRSYPWVHFTNTPSNQEKNIDWGYDEKACRLNANENPLGPSPKAVKAMEKALSQAHRYTRANQLIKELASFHKVSEDMVLTGCGSTEFLRIAPWAFLRNGEELITALQTYKTLGREAEKIEAQVKWIPLDKNFSCDLNSMKKAMTQKTKMIYIANPNNPTGTTLPFDALREFCALLPQNLIVFLDEAYSHFLDDNQGRDGITLIKQGYNVIVSRTFSKAYGLAGMRLGYVISKPSIIQELNTFSFRDMGINQAVYAAGVSSLEDENHIQKYKKLIREEKEYYSKQFESMGLTYIPSKTPFLMVKTDMPSKIAQKKLADRNVHVRKGQDWEMPDYLRISIGLPEENRVCVEKLKQVLNK